MRILFWQWNAFLEKGIEEAFRKMNMTYDVFPYVLQNWEKEDVFLEKLERQIRENPYDVVFSVNYTPLISQICKDFSMYYISWVYDSPVHIRNTEAMREACNRIYFFDRGQAQQYQEAGIPAYHLPLAASSEVFAAASVREKTAYGGQVALVGQLYQTDYLKYAALLEEYQRGYLEGLIRSQQQVYGGYFLGGLVTDELLEKLNARYREVSDGKIQIDQRQLEFLLASEVTGRERYLALALLSNRYKVSLYSKNRDERLKNVVQMGYVDYYTQMPQVFAKTQVNLNISLKTIQTGIPLRVLDVLACGGFLISNYQAEMEEYFRLGEDLVVYESLEDLVCKTDFYLGHESERLRIAENGKRRMEESFRFEDRIREMFPG